jgi:hypothetical protein
MGSAWPQRSLNHQPLRHVEPALFLSQPGDIRTQAIMFRLPDGGDFQQEVPRHSGDYTADGPHSGIY